jgi:hypothetical protein
MSSNWRRFEVLLPLQFNDGHERQRQSRNATYNQHEAEKI